jgi:hypothetical protein
VSPLFSGTHEKSLVCAIGILKSFWKYFFRCIARPGEDWVICICVTGVLIHVIGLFFLFLYVKIKETLAKELNKHVTHNKLGT